MAVREKQVATSVLVIGTGGSGLRAAIELAELGTDVLVVGKRPKLDAHTSLAAGGINAALGTLDAEDSWQQHAADTLKESYLLADPRTVQIVTEGARAGIEDLERYGMAFAREADGRISQRFFGAHKYRRTSFAGDYTGLEIQRTLVNRALALAVPIHATDVEGLYAIGEAASGLHGANRLGGNSLIELLVYGRITARAAARHSAERAEQRRSPGVVAEARTEIDALLAGDGPENVRALQRELRNTMTEHAGVVRDEAGLLQGLAELDVIERRMTRVGVHPDLASFQDLAHAFDLRSSALAARATLLAALERRETRGCHNRSDYPALDPALQVNLVWSPAQGITREPIPPIPAAIAALMGEVSTAGKLLE